MTEGRRPLSGTEWVTPTTEEVRNDLLALLTYTVAHGPDALDAPGGVEAALREWALNPSRPAGPISFGGTRARSVAQVPADGQDPNSHLRVRCEAVGCGVELGDPQDGETLCRGCLAALDPERVQ